MMLPCHCHLCCTGQTPSLQDIEAAAEIPGVAYETGQRSFFSYIDAKFLQPKDPYMERKLRVRLSAYTQDYREALACLNQGIMWLTDGEVQRRHLRADKADIDVAKCVPLDSMTRFKAEVLHYNSQAHKWQLKDDACACMRRQEPKGLRLKTRIRFGDDGLPDIVECERVQRLSVQEFIKELTKGMRNICISAPAGHGKTHFSRHVVRHMLWQRYSKRGVWITGSTGVAALGLDGKTIHSQSGLQRGQGTADELIKRMHYKTKLRWKGVKCILIDEISMISERFLNLLDEVARAMKGKHEAFGGVRMIFVGDFAQLPPISDLKQIVGAVRWKKAKAGYAFQSAAWEQAKVVCYRLGHCHRYDANSVIGKFLKSLRLARKLTASQRLMLNETLGRDLMRDDVTTLCSKKKHAYHHSLLGLGQVAPDSEAHKLYFGIDRRGLERRVCDLDDELKDYEISDDEKVYYDEQNRRPRAVFQFADRACCAPGGWG